MHNGLKISIFHSDQPKGLNMTTKIETTKREMYDLLDLIKKQTAHPTSMRLFESALEEHLEQLLQESKAITGLRNSFEKVAVDYTNKYLESEKENIGLRKRLQAFEHANAAAGAELRSARELITSQRQAFSDLFHSKRTQPCVNTLTILGAVIDCQQVVSDWAVYGHKAKGQMKKLAYLLNDSELREAMKAFEKADNCMHSFHPAFPGGELCTFCGVAK